MNQVYLVIEDNGESYDDYREWAIAAFDDEVKAIEYADKLEKDYQEMQVIEKQEYILYLEEENSLFKAIPWNPDITNEQNNLDNQDTEASIYEYLSEVS